MTETDTEVVAHLVERENAPGVPLEEAVRRSLKRMRGMYALVLLSADDPNKLVAARNGPPLVVGIGAGEFFVASDIPAILAHTRDVVFLADEEMAVVTAAGVAFSTFDGTPLDRTPQRVLWDPIQAEKAGYKHFMLKEIFEQPAAVRDTVLGRVSLETGRVFLNEINLTDEELARVEKVVVLACGTSWHAGLVGKFLIEELAQLPVEVDYGSEYRYRNPVVDDRSLAVVITQSGETADTLAALREAKRKGARSIAICNVVGSMATREAERHDLHARGAGDRRRVDQGLHVAAGGALPARAQPGAGAQDADAAGRPRAPRGAARPAAGARVDAQGVGGRRGDCRGASTSGATSSIWAAASTTPSPSRARSSSRRSPTSTPKATPPAR